MDYKEKEKKKKRFMLLFFSQAQSYSWFENTNKEAVLEDKTIGKWVKRIMLMDSSHPF